MLMILFFLIALHVKALMQSLEAKRKQLIGFVSLR